MIWYLSNTVIHIVIVQTRRVVVILSGISRDFFPVCQLVIPPQTLPQPHTVKLGGQKFTSFSQTFGENK